MSKSPLQVPNSVAEIVSDHVAPQKKTKGKKRVEMKREEVPSRRHVTFSKRKSGLCRKAAKLSQIANAEIALVVVSEAGRVSSFAFGTPSCDAVFDRYLASNVHNNNVAQYHNDNDNDNCSVVIEPAIVETSSPPSTNTKCSKIVELATPLSSHAQSPLFEDFEDNNILNDENLDAVNTIVSPAMPCDYQQEYTISTGGNSEAAAEEMTQMIEEMSKTDEVPACSEFVTDLIRVLGPSGTTTNFYTSLLVTVDEDELLMDNRGLGTCYFNPYADWSCTSITNH